MVLGYVVLHGTMSGGTVSGGMGQARYPEADPWSWPTRYCMTRCRVARSRVAWVRLGTPRLTRGLGQRGIAWHDVGWHGSGPVLRDCPVAPAEGARANDFACPATEVAGARATECRMHPPRPGDVGSAAPWRRRARGVRAYFGSAGRTRSTSRRYPSSLKCSLSATNSSGRAWPSGPSTMSYVSTYFRYGRSPTYFAISVLSVL